MGLLVKIFFLLVLTLHVKATNKTFDDCLKWIQDHIFDDGEYHSLKSDLNASFYLVEIEDFNELTNKDCDKPMYEHEKDDKVKILPKKKP